MNRTERIAHIARQERYFTRSLVGDDLSAGEWVELPGIGRIHVSVEAVYNPDVDALQWHLDEVFLG